MSDAERFTERLDGWRLRLGAAVDSLWPEAREREGAPVTGGLAPGALLMGRYRVEALLGEGAFGRVWRAYDDTSGNKVAIKELKAVVADEASLADTESQLAQEFFTLSRLKHPNIVAVSDYGEVPNGPRYLVMELVPGQDVHERLQHGPLPRQEAFGVLVGLLRGLELLHSRLYVHGDIKAENVRVTPQAHVKLMDFGLLHQLGTPATQVQGTVEYMAPEVMQGGVIDARTDLYSVGVLAYELFTGTLPFEGGAPLEIMRRHLGEQPKPPSHFLDLPAEIDELVLRLMAKSPDERFQTAREALARIADVGGLSLDAAPVGHKTSYLYSAHLIGRESEREQLHRMREALLRGEGSRLFIGGRGGEGKTRLLEELRLSVKLERLPFVGGQCKQGGDTPMRPIVDALSALVPRTPEELLAEHGPTLANLLPSVVERGHAAKRPADPAQAKVELYSALAIWLTELSKLQPFVLCIEDLHWADGGTVDVLNHLLRSLDDAAVWLLGTFRTNEVDKTSQLYATVHEGRSRMMELEPLTRDQVAELLASTLRGFAADDELLSTLHAKSGGNAFFVIETLRWLVEAGLLRADGDRWRMTEGPLELPESIVELVQRRLTHLPQELLSLCRQIAPVGRVLDLSLVQSLSGLEREALFEAFQELVAHQFLVRSKNEVRFAHDTVREGIYTRLEEDERRATHQRIAELYLKGRGKRADEVAPSEIAYHFKRGTEPDRAVPFFFQGAERARAMDQDLEATKLLLEGIEVLEASPKTDKRDELVRFYDRLAVVSPRALPPATVRAVDRLVEIWTDEIDVDEALRREARRNRLLSRLLPPALRARVDRRRVGVEFNPATRDALRIVPRMLEHQASQAFNLAVLGASERALDLSDRLQRTVPEDRLALHAWCRVARCVASVHTGRTEPAIAAAKEAQAILARADGEGSAKLQLVTFLAHYTHAMAESLAGYPPREELERQTSELARRSGKLQDRAFALLPRFVGACLRGTADTFQRYAAEADDIVQRLSFPQPLTSRLKLWIPVYYFDRNETDLAEAVIEKLEQYAHTSKDSWLRVYGAIYRGRLALARGRFEDADAILDEAVKVAYQLGLGRVTWALCDRARAVGALGRLAEARALVEEALARVCTAELACPYDEIVARRTLGELLEGAEGTAELERALRIARSLDNPVQEALSLSALAQRAQREGERTRSDTLAAEAGAIFEKLGQRPAPRPSQDAVAQ